MSSFVIIAFICIAFISTSTNSQPYSKQQFYCALQKQEVGSHTRPPWPVGDAGKALGPYQIWWQYWLDATAKPPSTPRTVANTEAYKRDANDKATAETLVGAYMKRYCKSAWSSTMSVANVEKCARIHNGGPKGYESSSTLSYWQSYQKYLLKCPSSSSPGTGPVTPSSPLLEKVTGWVGGKLGALLGLGSTPSVSAASDCGRFPSIELLPVTDEDVVRSPANAYDDPNDMDTCLFAVNDESTSGIYNQETKLSPHFKIKEFLSPDKAGYFRLSPTLVQCLEVIRAQSGPLNVQSGYRTEPFNAAMHPPGMPNSYHLSGSAANLRKTKTMSLQQMADIAICQCRALFAAKGYELGLALAADYLHLDMRKKSLLSGGVMTWIVKGASMDAKQWRTYVSTKECTATPPSSKLVDRLHGSGGGEGKEKTSGFPTHWNDVEIEYASGVDRTHEKIDEDLARILKEVISKSKQKCPALQKVYVSSIVRPVGKKVSNHAFGRAFDLSRINGHRMLSHYEDASKPVVKCATDAIQNAGDASPLIRENFGPLFKHKLGKPWSVSGHKDHIHISVNA